VVSGTSQTSQSSGITWYDVLGLLPDASPEQVQRQYDSKAGLLRPEFVTGAPSPVVRAVSRACEILDAARRVLADPANRARYDRAVGIRRDDGGLERPGSVPSQPGWELMSPDLETEALGAFLVLTDWMTIPHKPSRVMMPDVRGLFYSVCLEVTGKLGFHVSAVRLTEHPMPVDGLVVDQSPGPAVKARWGSTLTVQVWHPLARPQMPGNRV
jgi:hypothetical protein